MDIIFIRELRVETTVGILPWERAIKQKVCLDLDIESDIRQAAASDNIAHACDYAAVASRITAFVSASSYQLLETLAEHIAEILLTDFSIRWLRLKLTKPGAIPNAREVGVCIERTTAQVASVRAR